MKARRMTAAEDEGAEDEGAEGKGARDSTGAGQMDDTDDRSGNAAQSARTSFWWAYGGKEGREVFILKTTISGTPAEGEIEGHINSAIRAMGAVFRHGGRAKTESWRAKRETSDSAARRAASLEKIEGRASAAAPGGYEWGRARTGKSVLLIENSAGEPDEIECPIHPGKIMKRRSNEGGSWLSHKEGDTYCTARIQRHESLES
jgi:hypothetical protein